MDFLMKKGTYIIGDLCYLINDEKWDELCKNEFHKNDGDFIDFNFYNLETKENTTIKSWWHTTAYGDGCYEYSISSRKDIKNKELFKRGFPVDAGLIGIVPFEILNSLLVNDGLNKDSILESSCLMVVEIENDFEPRYENGTFVFKNFEIYTSDEDLEDDEEEESFEEKDY